MTLCGIIFIFYLDGCDKEYSCTVIQCTHVICSALLLTISYFVHRTYVTCINIQGNLGKNKFFFRISVCMKLSSSYLHFQFFYLTSEVMFIESSLPHEEIVILILTFSDPLII
jgi:hypothetical protein